AATEKLQGWLVMRISSPVAGAAIARQPMRGVVDDPDCDRYALMASPIAAKSESAKVRECRIAPSGDTSPKRAFVAPISPTSQTVFGLAITARTRRPSAPRESARARH